MVAYYLFRLAGLICPLLPGRLGYWLAARAGDLAFYLAGHRFKFYWSNLRRVLGDGAPPELMNSTAQRAFQNLVKNYFDLFRTHGMTPEQIKAQLSDLEGMQYLQQAAVEGRGVVAGSAHFGSWDFLLQVTSVYLKTEIVVPNERLKPEKLSRYVMSLRQSQGIKVVAIDIAPRAIIKAIRSGHIAGLACDRDITRTGPIVQFFGHPARMPSGPAQLALKYGAPVIMGFSVRQPDNKSRVYIEPPIQLAKTGNMEADICAGVQKMASVIEQWVRQYPDQWLVFQKLWED